MNNLPIYQPQFQFSELCVALEKISKEDGWFSQNMKADISEHLKVYEGFPESMRAVYFHDANLQLEAFVHEYLGLASKLVLQNKDNSDLARSYFLDAVRSFRHVINAFDVVSPDQLYKLSGILDFVKNTYLQIDDNNIDIITNSFFECPPALVQLLLKNGIIGQAGFYGVGRRTQGDNITFSVSAYLTDRTENMLEKISTSGWESVIKKDIIK